MQRELRVVKDHRIPSGERDIRAEVWGVNKRNVGKSEEGIPDCGRERGNMT